MMTDHSRKSSSPKRRRGAPLGNANAVKHGFYARQFRHPDIQEVEKIADFNLEDEIELMRLAIHRLLNASQTVTTFSESVELTRTLTLAANCITRLMFTYHRVKRYQGGLNMNDVLKDMLSELDGNRQDEESDYDRDEESGCDQA